MTWQPRTCFALIVRTFGLYFFAQSVPFVASFVDMKLFPTTDRPQAGAAAHLIYAMFDLSIAALFLLGTQTVVTLSFGDEANPDVHRPAPLENSDQAK